MGKPSSASKLNIQANLLLIILLITNGKNQVVFMGTASCSIMNTYSREF